MKVLIIDDERHMTEYLKHLITWENYGFTEVITINKALTAPELIAEKEPELVIVDVRMPEMTGLDIAEYVQQQKHLAKVIIISGYSEFEYARQAMKFGVQSYLVKPVMKREFKEEIEKVLPNLAPPLTSTKPELESVDEVIEFLKNYINEYYGESLSLESLGSLVHFNASYLSHYFKNATGENILTYLTNVRLEKAAELLATSDLRVNTIGEMVGYHKTQYFITIFKKKYGETPNQYRRKLALET